MFNGLKYSPLILMILFLLSFYRKKNSDLELNVNKLNKYLSPRCGTALDIKIMHQNTLKPLVGKC